MSFNLHEEDGDNDEAIASLDEALCYVYFFFTEPNEYHCDVYEFVQPDEGGDLLTANRAAIFRGFVNLFLFQTIGLNCRDQDA